MIVGDPHEWKGRFVTLDERLLGCILRLWPHCVALLPGQPEEDTVTINLVALLSSDVVVRRICYFVIYQHEPFGTRLGGAQFSKGKIDIAIVLDQERERYLAYECKRLNVINGGTRSSLATPYVREGMMRFLTEQYAAGLPVGCMLGYVMDCDLRFSLKKITAAIEAHKTPLALTADATQSYSISGIERFSTRHARASQSHIELRHVLLPFQVNTGTSPVLEAASGLSGASDLGA